jgi:copper chaperone NosL
MIVLLSTPATPAAPPSDVLQSPVCGRCGMDRGMFSHSRMLIEYEDGSKAASCSLHCAAVDLAITIDRIPVMVHVADYDSKELLDVDKAVWVLGGSKKGVMTAQAKWAFADRGAAERFIKTNGGKLVSFDEAIKAAYDDMYQDTKMIREMRKMKRDAPKAGGGHP